MHAAIVLLAIGIAGSSAYGSSIERRLTPGETMTIAGYTLTLRDVQRTRVPNATETRAIFDVKGQSVQNAVLIGLTLTYARSGGHGGNGE